MDGLLHLLGDTPWGNGIAWTVALIAAAGYIYSYLEKYRFIRNKDEAYKKEVNTDHEDLANLKKEVEAIKAQSSQIIQTLGALTKAIDGIKEYDRVRDVRDLKDRIRQSYYKYHNRGDHGAITVKERESLQGLIDQYLESGGNSFVKEVIMPEIPKWEEITDDDLKSMMHKRVDD